MFTWLNMLMRKFHRAPLTSQCWIYLVISTIWARFQPKAGPIRFSTTCLKSCFPSENIPLDSHALMPCQAPALQTLFPSMPIFRTYMRRLSIHIFRSIWGNKPVFECGFLRTFFPPTRDSLRAKLQFARLRWRRGGGGVHLHTSLMVRLLQITHDTSSDDIFQPLPCWMASPPPSSTHSTTTILPPQQHTH